MLSVLATCRKVTTVSMPVESKRFATWEEAVRWLRNQPDRQALVRDAYYDDPLIASAERYWCSEEWRAVRELLPRVGAALDIGAGRGIASYALARDGFTVTALEPDDSFLVGAGAIRELAREAALPITVVQDFSERLPFADASFDVVFARAVLHHTQDLAAACCEFARVLRPGGRMLAIREHVISRHADKQAFLDAHPLHRLYGGENAFLLSEYRSALEQAGLHLQQVLDPFESPINFSPYTLDGLQREIAQRAGRLFPGATGMLSRMLAVPQMWQLAWRVLAVFDNRPGRLYSFVAIKAGT